MNFDPQKFFIGLTDFFSILMPGAMLTYLGLRLFPELRNHLAIPPRDSGEFWMVFLFASYLIGHFSFLIGSRLDSLVYDRLRRCTRWGQITGNLARERPLSNRWLRRIASARWLFGRDADEAAMQVERIKARWLAPLGVENAINAFQWSKALLQKDMQEGFLTVQRFEADSKFFRSFVVVLAVLALAAAARSRPIAAGVCFAAMVPALWRYMDQRFKSTQAAYWFVILLESRRDTPLPASPRKDGLTLAGGIVFKGRGESAEYLLVQAEIDRTEWVLPKGHIEAAEDPRVTAVREVQEETGCLARIVAFLEDKPLGNEPWVPPVRWYLMEFQEAGAQRFDDARQVVWLSLSAARQRATFEETRALLDRAARHPVLSDDPRPTR